MSLWNVYENSQYGSFSEDPDLKNGSGKLAGLLALRPGNLPETRLFRHLLSKYAEARVCVLP
jgi:hypothetical protein